MTTTLARTFRLKAVLQTAGIVLKRACRPSFSRKGLKQARLAITALMLLSTFYSASAQEPATQVDQAIMQEYQRSRGMGNSLVASQHSLTMLLDDLKSNGMHDDEGSMKLESLRRTLETLNNEHATRVGEFLRRARTDQNVRAESLNDAVREINVVVNRLQDLMDEADLEQRKRVFISLLQEIVEHQWSLLKDTISWGRAAVENPDATNMSGEDLRLGQELAREKVISFLDVLKDAANPDDSEILNRLIEDVSAAITDRRVAFHQQNSADAIGEGDAAAATEEEQAALNGLQAALDILNGVEWEELQRLVTEAELKEKIREIVEKEKALRLDVLRVPDAELSARSGGFVTRQQTLAEELRALAPGVEQAPSKAVIGPAVEIALTEMAKASKALGNREREQAATAQLRVITTLEDILVDDIDMDGSDIAFQPLPMGLGDFGMVPGMEGGGINVPEGAGIGMGPGVGIGLTYGGGGSAIAFGGGMGPPGMGGQAGEGMGGMGEPGMGMGEAGMGMGEAGLGMGMGEGFGMGMGESGVPREAGAVGSGHRWGSDVVGGEDAESGAQSIGHLGAVARKQIQQIYEQKLPPEFRGLAQDYFEVLASGEK